jgi:anti-sigma regulatory factor (Ser/Thr protein kinase)
MTGHEIPAFRHEALFYAGEDEFVAGTLPFIRDAVAADEAILVAVSEARIRALRSELNGKAKAVHFIDMALLGRNPACIIPAWRDFVDEFGATGRPLRGIGEPIWAARSPAELVECQRHESLLNLAFAHAAVFWLLCPYDTGTLGADVLEEAQRSHPFVAEEDVSRESDAYLVPGLAPDPFDGELPKPSRRPVELAFDEHGLRAVRSFVSEHAQGGGLEVGRTADLVLAVSELTTNSVFHADGQGTVRMWREASSLLCEVRDNGRFDDPLVGRERPTAIRMSGRGLWLVNHLCDLVQLRSSPTGNIIRLHMNLG